MSDPFNLQRFVDAQYPIYQQVSAELRRGRKTTHWMWFVFPQIEGLGHSPMAEEYAVTCLAEAKAYLNHPILGPRLIECTEWVNAVEGRSIEDIFGYPDHLKFRSSMTLFAETAPDAEVFETALQLFFHGDPDELTLDLL